MVEAEGVLTELLHFLTVEVHDAVTTLLSEVHSLLVSIRVGDERCNLIQNPIAETVGHLKPLQHRGVSDKGLEAIRRLCHNLSLAEQHLVVVL